MKLEDFRKKRELIGTALLAVSVLSAVLIAIKVTGFYVVSANAGSAVERAIGRSKPDDKNVTAQLDKSRIVADALKKQNLFSPPAPRRHPVNAVLGILGDEALINGRWYKAGAKVADAKILAVDPTSVTIEWDGREKVFKPIDGGASSGPSGPSRPNRPKTVSSTKGSPQLVVTNSAAAAKPHPVDSSVVKTMKKSYDNMSEAKKDKFKKVMAKSKEQYKQMSDAEKASFKAELIKKLDRSKERGDRQPVKLRSK